MGIVLKLSLYITISVLENGDFFLAFLLCFHNVLSSSTKLHASAGGSLSSGNAHREAQQCCSSPSVLSVAGCLFSRQGAEPESEDPGVLGEVRTGKWRVPTCRDYVDLFRSLLSCDQTMVNTAAESH